MKQEELQEIAAQLKMPTGAKGIEIAHMMEETNLNMTLSSIRNLKLSQGDTILELGHGNAAHVEHLMRENTNLRYYGLEMSDLMFREAQKINQQLIARKAADFVLYDGNKIPFSNAFFDSIFTVNTLYFWPDPKKVLSEIYRVLKPNGIFCLTFSEESFMKQLPFTQFEFELYSAEKAVKLIQETAFQISKKETLTEKVKTKTGALMDRDFTTLVLTK